MPLLLYDVVRYFLKFLSILSASLRFFFANFSPFSQYIQDHFLFAIFSILVCYHVLVLSITNSLTSVALLATVLDARDVAAVTFDFRMIFDMFTFSN